MSIVMLLFADDVVLMSYTREHLMSIFTAFMDFCKQHKLKVSATKTKGLIFGNMPEPAPLLIDGN